MYTIDVVVIVNRLVANNYANASKYPIIILSIQSSLAVLWSLSM